MDPFEMLKAILTSVKDDPTDIVKDLQMIRKLQGEGHDADQEN